MISKRVVFALLAASLWVMPPALLAQSRPLKKIQVGVPAISMGNIVIFFTKEAKIYEVYKHEPEDFIDASFVEELDKSGFIKKLYEK